MVPAASPAAAVAAAAVGASPAPATPTTAPPPRRSANTVVHERAPRSKADKSDKDEIQGISVRPGWRPSGSVAATAATPVAAARRS